MHALRDAIARRPIASYLLIAFASSWAMTPLVSVSVGFPMLNVSPAASGVASTAFTALTMSETWHHDRIGVPSP